MISVNREEPIWLEIAHTIETTVVSIRDGTGLSRTTKMFFAVPVLRDILAAINTHLITGPSCLDRTLVMHPQLSARISALKSEDFYHGEKACHHENGEWIPQLFSIRKIACLAFAAVLLVRMNSS